ncbi:hypothetical protein, partial [Priestia aryabhattai]
KYESSFRIERSRRNKKRNYPKNVIIRKNIVALRAFKEVLRGGKNRGLSVARGKFLVVKLNCRNDKATCIMEIKYISHRS